MKSLAEKLESVFWDILPTDMDTNELVSLMTLDDNELEERFQQEPRLYQTYLPDEYKDRINVIQEQEEESSSSDDEVLPSTTRANVAGDEEKEFYQV